jgi:hypothetical protein
MEAYLLRPIQRVESQSISSGFMLFLAIFFGLILVVVLVIAFSS